MPSNASKSKSLKARDKKKERAKGEFSDILSDLLDKSCESFRMTAAELSKRADISTGIISGYRNCKNAPTLTHLKAIAKSLGVSTDYLLGLTKDIEGNADIMAVENRLGISPVAQKKLIERQDNKDKYLFGVAEVINTLLENDPVILQNIAGYLWHEYKPQYHPKMFETQSDETKEAIMNNIWLTEKNTGYTQTIPVTSLPAVYLMNIQERLTLLRESIRKDSDTNGEGRE